MITSIVQNCPKCGKENQYAMDSCRNCGTERPIQTILDSPPWMVEILAEMSHPKDCGNCFIKIM